VSGATAGMMFADVPDRSWGFYPPPSRFERNGDGTRQWKVFWNKEWKFRSILHVISWTCSQASHLMECYVRQALALLDFLTAKCPALV
jgi:hypothetical protein